ncbi:MAG TPA: ATP-grasp domain-containing protein [Saprospiraceae bacterium]|nr:ATP-grasp domain-containing protein [Saprospiraceae bacterium]
MPFVVYATPNFTENAVRFIHTLTNIPDVQLGLITEEPVVLLRHDLSARLYGHRQVANPLDPKLLEQAARELTAQHGPIHRIIGAVEIMQVPLAQVREALGIEGMGVETALNFRDKARMKAKLREAGIPCARYQTVASPAEARTFAELCGFPLIAKPPAGMGSLSTYKIHNHHELDAVLREMPPSPGHEVLFEEFVTGTEHSFDTFSLNGQAVFHSLTHYHPNPIEVMREPWIQWQVVLPREIDVPEYDDIRQAAFKTLDVLGMKTGLSHLEWFRRPDGSVAVSEVAARPPGAQITTLMSRANDFDSLDAWARMIIFGEFKAPERKYAVGAAYLRGMGSGFIKAVHGLEKVDREVGHLITDAKIPEVGRPHEGNYEGVGYIILRHPETHVVEAALKKVVSLVRIELS